MPASRTQSILVGVLALAASFAIAADELPLREVLVALFLVIAPGVALLRLAGITDRVAQFALVVPVSLSIDALVVTVIEYLGIWSPELMMLLIVAVTVSATAVAPYERSARAALVVIALLPCIVLLSGGLTVG